MTIVYRSVKGSNLTPTEVDNNFHDVDNRITTIEGLDIGKSIESIDVTGNVMTITYTDTSTDSFELPVANWVDLNRGEWQPLTPYVQNELITALGNLYVIAQDHTSEATFDPNAADTGGNFYQLLLRVPAVQVFERSTITFTPVAADENSYNRCTHASGCLVTLPLDSSHDFPINTEFHFRQCATAAPVEIDASTGGITVNGMEGFTNATSSVGSVITVKKVGPDEWDLFGRLTVI